MHLTRLRQRIGSIRFGRPGFFLFTLFITLHFASFLIPGALDMAEAGEKSTASEKENPDEKIYVFDFKEAALSDVLNVFTDLTDKNVVANENIRDLKVTIFLKQVPPRAALEILCKQNNLWYKEDDNHIRLLKVEDFGKDIIIEREEKTRVFDLKYASAEAVADAIASLMEDKVEYCEPGVTESYGQLGAGEAGAGGGAGRGGQGRGGRGGGSTGVGGRGGGGRGGGGARVTREVHIPTIAQELTPEMVRELLRKEGETEEERPEIKVEEIGRIKVPEPLAYMTVFLPNNSILVYSADREILKEIAKLIGALDTPIRQVLLQGKILEITLTDDFTSLFDLSYQSSKTTTRTYPELTTAPRHSGVLGRFGELEGGTLLYTFFGKDLEARVELLKKDGRVKTIGTPMVLCANNAPAKFFIGEERPVVTNYEFEIRDFEERTTETIRPVMSLKEIGTKLEIIPRINENRTVTMRLVTEISTLGPGATVSQVDQYGNVIALPIDTINTSTVEAIIVANNEETVAIGGLLREEDSVVENKVPCLGSIPLLGFFFKKFQSVKEKTEMVLLIVPHIMMKPEEIGVVSDRVMKGLSEHPYIKDGKEKLLRYDEKDKSLESLTEEPGGEIEKLLEQ